MSQVPRERANTVDSAADAEGSEVELDAGTGAFARVSAQESLTQAYWGIDLLANLPCQLTSDGVTAVQGDALRAGEFLRREFPLLTEEGLGGVSSQQARRTKHHYLLANCDLFEIRHHGQTVGVVVGEPKDWSTYYIRMFAIVQAYQRPALIRRFSRTCIVDPLTRHGVQRITADTSPANLAMSRFLTEFRFYVTGQQLTDRWGPAVQYTKFLDPACEAAFHARFGGAAPPGSNGIRKDREQ